MLDTASPDERYGYRLKSGVIQARLNGLACDADSWTDVTDGNTYSITALLFAPATSTVDDMTVREINISLSAELVNDPDVTRSISKTVRLRNDLHNP